jgi:hypothetical protein
MGGFPWAPDLGDHADDNDALQLGHALRDHGFRPTIDCPGDRVVVSLDMPDARRLTDLLRGAE